MPKPENDVQRPQSDRGRDYMPNAEGTIEYGLERFLTSYNNLGFGWEVAVTFARNHIPFPGVLEGDDVFIYRAYLHNCDRRYFCQPVWEAQSLHRKSMAHRRATLEAMLMVGDITVEEVAKQLKMHLETVIAYEKLFFNVLDRRHDDTFIANVAYPDGRFIETVDDYMRDETTANLLKRLGFNYSIYEVLHWAGYRSGLLGMMSGVQTPAQLEALIMANGLLLAKSGFLNQQTNSSGIHHAKTLLAAAKQGGEEVKSTSPFATMGNALIGEIQHVKGDEADLHIQKRIGLRREKVV